jgi:hypothetical protein
MQKVSEIALEHPKNLWANGDDGDNNNDDIPPLVSDDWSGKSLLSVRSMLLTSSLFRLLHAISSIYCYR